MAYDERLAERIRRVLGPRPDVSERQMFGGVAFMVRGHMAVGIVKDDLMVRVGAEAYAEALRRPHARPMDFTGKPLGGFIYVAPAGVPTAPALRRWVHGAVAYVEALPAKPRAKRKPRPPAFPKPRARRP